MGSSWTYEWEDRRLGETDTVVVSVVGQLGDALGAGWRGDFVTDTCWVPSGSEISVPAGDFSVAFRVEETWGALNSYGAVTTWIVPGVGVVMEDRQEVDLGPGPSYVRRLIDYNVVRD